MVGRRQPLSLTAELIALVDRKEPDEIVAATGFDAQVVADMVRRMELSEFKRRQAAPGIKVTAKAFGIGRRNPIARAL